MLSTADITVSSNMAANILSRWKSTLFTISLLDETQGQQSETKPRLRKHPELTFIIIPAQTLLGCVFHFYMCEITLHIALALSSYET